VRSLAKQVNPTMRPDVARAREDVPILARPVHGKRLVYLDNAATTQKPRAVLDALEQFYTEDCANIHRGVHVLSERATAAYEGARTKVQQFLNARAAQEIVFVRGATEGINLVAYSYGRTHIRAGDEVVISAMEHHSNIVPWQILCDETGAKLRVIPMNERGELLLAEFERLLSPKTKLISMVYVSNALGTVNPVRAVVDLARARGVPVLVDASQAVPHMPVDVVAMDCDFLVFSGHKLFGPTGIGVLYGKAHLLEDMPPFQGGGDMILSVTFEKTLYNVIPHKFEAGTPAVAQAIGLGAAIDWVLSYGFDAIARHEQDLLLRATEAALRIPGLRLIGTAREKTSVLSFVLDGIHPHDIGTILDREGVAIRSGHHCAQPVMQHFGVPATARASFALYNTREDVERLVAGIHKVLTLFA